MKASRITAVGLVAGAALWIASGHLMPRDSANSEAAIRPAETKAQPAFRVSVTQAKVVEHSPKLTLSGRTEADHKVSIAARTGGVLTQLNVTRGQHVKKGDVIAVLADEAREAQVAQAQALYDQRKAELEARRVLIDKGTLPKLDLVNLESQYKAAEAALAGAPELDLRTTNLDRYFAAHPQALQGVPEGERAAVVGQMKAMQRVVRVLVAPRGDHTMALLEAGLRSARGIARAGRARFVEKFAPIFGGEAPAIHTYSQSVHSSGRTVSAGSSASTLPMPVTMAELMARHFCTSRRASGPVIHCDSPLAMAVRPSRLSASLTRTKGRPVSMRWMKPALSARASASSTPARVAMPAAASRARPRPATSGLGSVMAATTSATPAATRASAQGGVRPWWLQGSRVT